jgi:hypothetical protein
LRRIILRVFENRVRRRILRVFENGVRRRIFEPKLEEITGGWRKLYNKDLHNLYFSPDIVRKIKSNRKRLAGHVALTEAMRNACTIFNRKT